MSKRAKKVSPWKADRPRLVPQPVDDFTLDALEAIPNERGDFEKGYIWIGLGGRCVGTVDTRALLTFVRQIKTRRSGMPPERKKATR